MSNGNDIGKALCRLVGIDTDVTLVTAITVAASVGCATVATVECITMSNDVGDIETLTRTFVEVCDDDHGEAVASSRRVAAT